MLHHDINEGTYKVQSGWRNNVGIIHCPYVSHIIEVNQALSLKIFDGAQVFWTQVRRQYPTKRKGNKQVISAVVVGIKHCDYLCHGKNILCTIKVSKSQGSFKFQGIPLNKKLPKFDIQDSEDLLFDKTQNLSQEEQIIKIQQRYYWGRFLFWQYEEELPRGVLCQIFRDQYKTPQVQTEVILHNMEINQKKSLMSNKYFLSKKYKNLPIRGHRQETSMVFTIDPPNSVDIEDGFSLQILEDQKLYEVGVHISDVTSFKTLLNRKEIAEKGTSIYLPHKTLHLMPQQLVQLCALKPKQDRLAFSVYMKLDLNGKLSSTRFEKTIVKNQAQLSYEQAQNILDKEIDSSKLSSEKCLSVEQFNQLEQKLNILKTIADNRRKTRQNTNIYDKDQIVFQLDNSDLPINIGLKKRIDSQKLVEQFMIMTNYEVAKQLVQNFGLHSLIIYHPKPADYNIENLNDYASGLGVNFKLDSLMFLEKQIKKLFEKEQVKDELKQLLLHKAMQIQQFAVYTRYLNTYKGHYGLNLDYYTHFTSPIRRFADFIVHEQLEKCINGVKYTNREIEILSEEIELINRARSNNKKLKLQITECFMNLFLFHTKEKIKTKGFITSLGLFSANIYVPHYNIIKEVAWSHPAVYLDKDKIEVTIKKNGKNLVKQFQKNEAVNLQFYHSIHQQVHFNVILKIDNQEVVL